MRHRSFFAEPVDGKGEAVAYLLACQTRPARPLWYHVLMLLMTLAPIVALSTSLAVIVDFGIEHLGAPAPVGGILVAILVLSPEGLSVRRGARQSIAAGGEYVSRLGACHHRPHRPGGARHWAMDGLRGASRARPRRCRASHAYAVPKRAHLRRRSNQRCCKAPCIFYCSSSISR
jgi:hypothetical protein